MMKPQLYRLYAVQNFGRRLSKSWTGGPKHVAVYLRVGDYEEETLQDALEIVREVTSPEDVLNPKARKYPGGYTMTDRSPESQLLIQYVRYIRRARELIEKGPETHYAMFVDTANFRDWKGERTMYFNKFFEEIKTDTPTFNGCEPIRTINLYQHERTI